MEIFFFVSNLNRVIYPHKSKTSCIEFNIPSFIYLWTNKTPFSWNIAEDIPRIQ